LKFSLHLLGIAGLVILAIVLDLLLFFYRPPGSLEILFVADGVILVGLAVDVIFRLRQRSVHSRLFRRLAESAPLADSPHATADSPMQGFEAQGSAKELVYRASPEGLAFPAFVCTCGHLHQFLCLTCRMTVESARQIKDTKWAEWTPDTKEVDY
jgi:hypothetical protein